MPVTETMPEDLISEVDSDDGRSTILIRIIDNYDETNDCCLIDFVFDCLRHKFESELSEQGKLNEDIQKKDARKE